MYSNITLTIQQPHESIIIISFHFQQGTFRIIFMIFQKITLHRFNMIKVTSSYQDIKIDSHRVQYNMEGYQFCSQKIVQQHYCYLFNNFLLTNSWGYSTTFSSKDIIFYHLLSFSSIIYNIYKVSTIHYYIQYTQTEQLKCSQASYICTLVFKFTFSRVEIISKNGIYLVLHNHFCHRYSFATYSSESAMVKNKIFRLSSRDRSQLLLPYKCKYALKKTANISMQAYLNNFSNAYI